jgi:YidC/Oxa1 family membrane protein insertase
MDNQRLILFVALGLILLMIYQAWEQQTAPPPAAPVASAPGAVEPAAPGTGAAEVPKVPEAPSAPTARERAPVIARAERIEVTTDLFQATIDTAGGDLRELRLRKHPVAVEHPDQPFPLMRDDEEIFVAQSGLVGHGFEFPTHRTQFTVPRSRYVLEETSDELRVPLSYQGKDGVRYTKTYVFRRDSYTVELEYAVTNASGREWNGFLYGQFQRSYADTSGGLTTIATFTGAAIYTPAGKYEKLSFDHMAEKPLKREVTGGWVAMLQHYFVGAWLPARSERTEFYTDKLEGNRYVAGYKQLEPTTVAPGQSGLIKTHLYAGPKQHRRLELLACPKADLAKRECSSEEQVRAPGMELTVDYGALTFISAPLFKLLDWIYGIVRNWGWAIVILTFLVKLVFYPLSAMSYKSMAKMRKVAPKLESIKKTHGHDRQALNQAMMELYKTEKINPFGGCLPILIQIPVFIALYWVLLESVEMRQAPWILWINDLSTKDPYFVLPLLMGASMYLQQQLSPQPPDPMQRKVFMLMPVIFTGMFVFFPAGLVLYWTVNNLLSIAQQWRINTVIAGKGKAA